MTSAIPAQPGRVLVTGATGFVGTHLLSALAARGHEVLGGARHPESAQGDHPNVRFCHLDLDDGASVARALSEVDRAVYLVHGMTDAADYAEAERRYAQTFRDAAASRSLARIVYLGGMRPRGRVSYHLESRLATGEILRSGPVPVVELQATMIVGEGSESFRIVRDLAARLPGMVLPRWLRSRSEPVAVDDVVAAIAHALTMPLRESVVLSAPGPEALSGREIIAITARAMGHAPWMAEIPLVTPHLSSYWIRLVTRANPRVATELVEGLRSDIVSRGPTIWEGMVGFQRTPFDAAVRAALAGSAEDLRVGSRVLEGLLHRVFPRPRARAS